MKKTTDIPLQFEAREVALNREEKSVEEVAMSIVFLHLIEDGKTLTDQIIKRMNFVCPIPVIDFSNLAERQLICLEVNPTIKTDLVLENILSAC